MLLLVGLGNPGAKYAQNRHNIGFMAVDAIADDHGFGPWRSKFQGKVSEGVLAGEKVVLLKPGTFMNLSGQSVGEAARFYKLGPAEVTVFHDELDLAPGKLRVKRGGGHAGHNGLRSIQSHLGADYARVRLGIGHPGHKDRVTHYVLQDFSKADGDWIDDLMRGIADGAPWLAEGKPDRFQNAVAQRTTPNHPASPKPAPDTGAKPAPSTAPAPEQATENTGEGAEDTRSPLQRLVDRFR
jgi:PTH1 family peptidyl-tRNA hydrolase